MSDKQGRAQTAIIIVNWNTAEMTARCLHSIGREVTEGMSSEIQVIVVDNASSDDSVALLHGDFPGVRVICNETNVGFARANNQAIKASRSEFVLLLNSDTLVHQGAIRELVAFMENRPQAGAAGAMLLNEDGSLQESCRPMLTPGREMWRLTYLDQIWPRSSYRMTSWDMREPRQIEVMMGACMMLRRSALDEVGLLDEQYFMYTEEVDLCYRLAEGRWELWYVPSARVTHYGQASSRQVAEEMFVELYRSKVQFYRKVGGSRLTRRFKRMLRIAYWPRLVVSKLTSPFSQASSFRSARYSRLLRELPGM